MVGPRIVAGFLSHSSSCSPLCTARAVSSEQPTPAMLTLVFHEALNLAIICCDPYLPRHRLVLQEDDLAVATVSLWSSLAPVAGHCGSPLHAIHALLQDHVERSVCVAVAYVPCAIQ